MPFYTFLNVNVLITSLYDIVRGLLLLHNVINIKKVKLNLLFTNIFIITRFSLATSPHLFIFYRYYFGQEIIIFQVQGKEFRMQYNQ